MNWSTRWVQGPKAPSCSASGSSMRLQQRTVDPTARRGSASRPPINCAVDRDAPPSQLAVGGNKKLQLSVHGLGAEAAVAVGAAVGTTSAADASTPQEAPAAAMITAAKSTELCTASLPGSASMIVGWNKIGRQESTGAVSSHARKFRSEWQPRHIDRRPMGSAATVAVGRGSRLPLAMSVAAYDFNPLGDDDIRSA